MLRFKLGGLEISISFWFFAAIGFFVLHEHSILFSYIAMPIILHELGHVTALYLCGGEVRSIKLRAFGIVMGRSGPHMSYTREALITFAGAGANLIAAGILYAAMVFPTMRSMLLIAANIAAAVFSLLPINGLDGGDLLRLLTERFGGVDFAYRVSKLCSFLVLVPLFAAAFWLLMRPEPNITLLAVCVYLTVIVCSN